METGGEVAAGYEWVRDAFQLAHHDDPGGSQLCVYRNGERIVDLWTGTDMGSGRAETGDTLHVLMSTTKGALALVAAVLVASGQLDVDAPVGAYWPEYAVAGKEGSTVAHFLTHTAGLPVFRAEPRVTAADLSDWEFCTRALAEAEPFWMPGAAFMYHAITYGFLVGEVIRRVAGCSAGAFFAEHIAAPLGLDFWIGLPADRSSEVALQAARTSEDYFDGRTIAGSESALAKSAVLTEIKESGRSLGLRFLDGYLTSLAGRTCELGAVNGVANARSVARMYAATIGEVDGVRLLSADALAAALRPRNQDVPVWEPFAGLVPAGMANYGLGFQRWHPLGDHATTKLDELPAGRLVAGGMGTASTFGHGGAGGIRGYASVELGVAVGYTCSAMHNRTVPDPRHEFIAAMVEAGLS